MAKDYYSTLGVSKTATKDEIKKAYRKLAHQHHPDKQGGNEAKFKEINEAYQILGDEQKRTQYDRFGTGFNDNAGGRQRGGGGFGGFSSQGEQWDFGGFQGGASGFEDIFDMFSGGGRSAGTGPRRGQDIKIDIGIDLEDSVSGKEIEINFKKLSSCDNCRGKGGFDPENCARCKGSGRVNQTINSIFGTMTQVVACSKCHGKGKSFKKTCNECSGHGRSRKANSFNIKIPKGIIAGEIIKFSGEGEAGEYGESSGDLFVQIHFNPHKQFKNEGHDIYYKLTIDMARAALGDKIAMPTLYGEVKLSVDPGVQPGETIKISGKGLPKRGSWGGHGDMYVKVKVEVPKHLTKKQKELLEEFKNS